MRKIIFSLSNTSILFMSRYINNKPKRKAIQETLVFAHIIFLTSFFTYLNSSSYNYLYGKSDTEISV